MDKDRRIELLGELHEKRLRAEVIDKIRDNLELMVTITFQIGELTHGLVDAGDRMARGLGQNPDAEPLPPVHEFFLRVQESKDRVREIMSTIRLLGNNHNTMVKMLMGPVMQ